MITSEFYCEMEVNASTPDARDSGSRALEGETGERWLVAGRWSSTVQVSLVAVIRLQVILVDC